MQKQIASLYRLMETEIVKKDDATITKLKTLANQLNNNLTAYLNAGQELKQKSTLVQRQQGAPMPGEDQSKRTPGLGNK